MTLPWAHNIIFVEFACYKCVLCKLCLHSATQTNKVVSAGFLPRTCRSASKTQSYWTRNNQKHSCDLSRNRVWECNCHARAAFHPRLKQRDNVSQQNKYDDQNCLLTEYQSTLQIRPQWEPIWACESPRKNFDSLSGRPRQFYSFSKERHQQIQAKKVRKKMIEVFLRGCRFKLPVYTMLKFGVMICSFDGRHLFFISYRHCWAVITICQQIPSFWCFSFLI